MEMRKLGREGLEVSAMGLGCMRMSEYYGSTADEQESIATIHRALDTGHLRRPEDLAENDIRRRHPRFQGENFDRNLRLVDRVKEMAAEKHVTPAQLALAWVLAQGEDVVPIPGTKRRKYLEDNVGALRVQLTPEDLARLDQAAPKGATAGNRYADMSTVNR